MNVQTVKLDLIEELLAISDAKLLSRVALAVKAEIAKTHGQALSPMTMEEYRAMVDSSLKDVRNGRVVGHDELKKEIGQWGGK
ncbi:MAG: hypothetical protein LBH06_01595 [Rikenellaceae bacterium]|jgi:predicted transcriptional regulator|nr:hypothetical protein [Rikenellaceae bacterium]